MAFVRWHLHLQQDRFQRFDSHQPCQDSQCLLHLFVNRQLQSYKLFITVTPATTVALPVVILPRACVVKIWEALELPHIYNVSVAINITFMTKFCKIAVLATMVIFALTMKIVTVVLLPAKATSVDMEDAVAKLVMIP